MTNFERGISTGTRKQLIKILGHEGSDEMLVLSLLNFTRQIHKHLCHYEIPSKRLEGIEA